MQSRARARRNCTADRGPSACVGHVPVRLAARIADVDTSSYWLAEQRPPLPIRTGRAAGATDVAIVGGGVTGCACALALAQAGKRVRVFEAREIAGGASGRNGGFALRGGAPAYDSARRDLGAEPARVL